MIAPHDPPRDSVGTLHTTTLPGRLGYRPIPYGDRAMSFPCGCVPVIHRFKCPACLRWVGWCFGCDESDLCDDCATAHAGETIVVTDRPEKLTPLGWGAVAVAPNDGTEPYVRWPSAPPLTTVGDAALDHLDQMAPGPPVSIIIWYGREVPR